MRKTMVLQVRFESWYISLLSSAKQQREMIKLSSTYFGEREPQWLIFRIFFKYWPLRYMFSLSKF